MEINIALDFSRIPGARYPEEGDFSGQEFRQTILLPKLQEAIKKKEMLTINLDGTAGLGTSFLEESFGGLIRVDKFDIESLKNTLEFISEEDPDYITEIWSYINEAYEQESK